MTKQEEIERLDAAIEKCKIAQFRPKEHEYFKNPITEQELILNTARSQRHFETKRDGGKTGITPVRECMYCNFQTTPTLFYINWEGEIVFPDHRELIEKIKESIVDIRRSFGDTRSYMETLEEGLNQATDHYRLVKAVAPWNQLEGDWLCRVFLNLTPAIVQRNGKANCFLIACHSAFHYSEICDLPEFVLEAVFESMNLLADWAKENGLVLNPFYNGGKSLASGQSVDCFHFQVYALQEMPKLYKDIKKRWRDGDCSVCRVMSAALLGSSEENCRVSQEGEFEIYVHPYPEYNFTWLITKTRDCTKFEQIDSRGLARALKKAVSFYPLLFNTMPGYNIVFRLSEYVGHFHVEIIPRTNTNIIAGCELNTKTIVITQDPRDVAAAIREKAKEKGIKL